MSRPTILSILFLICFSPLSGQKYSDYFTDKACRIDLHFSGNSHATTIYVNKIKQEPFWGGRRSNLSEFMNLGQYRFRVIDSLTNLQIYVDGFNTLYSEWQSTPEALTINKSFEQTIQFPYPLKPVKLFVEQRTGFDTWEKLSQFSILPDDKLISKSEPTKVPVRNLINHASPDKAIDIAIIAEGYTKKQLNKFFNDAQKLAESLVNHEPFRKHKAKINIYAVGAISVDSGVSIPQLNNWKNTALGSHFYTFYSDRYLTTSNVFKVYDYASLVPYDAVYILANTKIYGGGGIYNSWALASSDSKRAQAEVVVHEFGHSFAGLGDEYFYDHDALENLYDKKVEPWEPNITTLVNFDAKWKSDLPAETRIPTPVTEENKTKLGVFEGGGYATKGIYRPMFNCRMRTNDAKGFCPVCEKAVEKRILFLTTPETTPNP